MRIIEAYFKNWIGIYLGLGVTELKINLRDSKWRYLLILGKNGSGKTTIEEGLTLFTDIYSAQRDSNDFILKDENGNRDGYRELHVEHKGVVYISKVYWLKDKTRCFLSKIVDGEETELNPSGNVRSYEDAVEDHLKLTRHREKLLFLGSGMRDIITMPPSERKNYISTFIPNTDKYLELFKNTAKYHSKLKRDIQVLTSEIEKLGNDKNVLKENVELLTEKYEAKLEDIQKKKNAVSNTENTISALSIGGESLVEKYERNLTFHEKRVNDIRVLNNEYEELRTRYGIGSIPLKELETIKTKARDILQETKINAKNLNTRIDELTSVLSGLNYALSAKIQSYETYKSENDPEIFLKESESLKLKLDEISSASSVIFKEILNVKSLNDILFSKSDATQYMVFADGLMERIRDIEAKFDGSIIQGYILDTLKDEKYEDEYLELSDELNGIEKEIEEVAKLLDSDTDIFAAIHRISESVGECHDPACPYTAYIRNFKEKYKSKSEIDAKFRGLNERKSSINAKLDEIRGRGEAIRDFYRKITDLSEYTNSFSQIADKFPDTEMIFDMQVLLRNRIFVLPHARRFLELAHLKEEMDGVNAKLREIEDKIHETSKYFDNLAAMEMAIETEKKQLSKVQHEVQQLNNTIYTVNDDIKDKEKTSCDMERLYSLRVLLARLLKEHSSSYKMLKTLNKNYSYALAFSKGLERLKDRIERIDIPELNAISADKQKAEYNIRRFDEFVKSREELESSYSLLDILRKSWSPTTGIPLIFIEDFMNKFLESANRYLKDIWSDTGFRIHSFGIDEKNFSIFVTRKDNALDEPKDASQCSGAERAMLSVVLSLALMERLPHIRDAYNIVKFDEIDGSLDYSRSGKFMNILNGLLDGIENEQTIMVTHSNILSDGADVLIIGDCYDEYAERLLTGEYNIIRIS